MRRITEINLIKLLMGKGKDIRKRKTEGYRFRWSEFRLKKQKLKYESRIKRLKENHKLFIHLLRVVLENFFNIKWRLLMRLVRKYQKLNKEKSKEIVRENETMNEQPKTEQNEEQKEVVSDKETK